MVKYLFKKGIESLSPQQNLIVQNDYIMNSIAIPKKLKIICFLIYLILWPIIIVIEDYIITKYDIPTIIDAFIVGIIFITWIFIYRPIWNKIKKAYRISKVCE